MRMEAVRTCAALLVPNLLSPSIFTTPYVSFSAASAQVVGDVLKKLLTVGITDEGMTIYIYMYMYICTYMCVCVCVLCMCVCACFVCVCVCVCVLHVFVYNYGV